MIYLLSKTDWGKANIAPAILIGLAFDIYAGYALAQAVKFLMRSL